MKSTGGIGERGGPVRIGCRFGEVRVKHNLRSMPRGPADGLRIPPAFVTDRDTEGQGPGLKDAAACARRVDALFGRVDLYLVLKACDRSAWIDHQRRGYQSAVHDAFGSENHRDVSLSGDFGDEGPGAF